MKVYVDSRHRISGTNEDFVWQIPETVDIPDSWCYIDCVLVPNTFFSIRQNYNNKVYLKERVGTTDHYIVLNIQPGQYNGVTLATALQTAMNAVTQMGASNYTVVYDVDTAKIKITSSAATGNQFTIFGEIALKSGQWNTPIDAVNIASANKVCGFNEGQLVGTANPTVGSQVVLVGDGVIDVQRHHCCYIHSDLGEPGSSWGCRGESDVIRRVVIDSAQNSLSIDRHSTSWDAVEVGNKALRSMSFRLCDDNGVTVDLRGHHWSFSLVFHEKL